ncbi:hypothetical protein [Streptomyces bauhiniae]|uniref:hypothetical protein n=1 Tax=Streptomyces bauhiniae TaxID=2340725 RepID=UPI0035E0A6C9
MSDAQVFSTPGVEALTQHPSKSLGWAEILRPQSAPCKGGRLLTDHRASRSMDRLCLLRIPGDGFRQAREDIKKRLPFQEWSSPAGSRAGLVGNLADLAAARLFVKGETPFLDEALINDSVTKDQISLARCIASGLRRLPLHRGPVWARTDAPSAALDWYRNRTSVADHSFWSARTGPMEAGSSAPDFLLWSLTGRRVGAIDLDDPNRLIFPPGVRFKILKVVRMPQPVVLMREFFPYESAEMHELAESENSYLTWLDHNLADELTQLLRDDPRSPCDGSSPASRLPGVVVTESRVM